MSAKATQAQIQRLMTVYNQLSSREVGVDASRDSRMTWASTLLQRPITTFSSLSLSEATHLIDQAQAQLGHRAPLKGVRSRRDAQRAGVEGRHCAGAEEFTDQPQMVSAKQTTMIQRFVERLDWTEDNFKQWLRAPRSPLRGRVTIRTTLDANKVIFGLKGVLRQRGLWNEAKKKKAA